MKANINEKTLAIYVGIKRVIKKEICKESGVKLIDTWVEVNRRLINYLLLQLSSSKESRNSEVFKRLLRADDG